MTSTYSISNILHIYDDLVNQKLAITSSLSQAKINFLDSFINAVLRVIGGAWFDKINVSRILPHNDQQTGSNNEITIGQSDTIINIESTISHFIMNNTRKTLFYATSQNESTNPTPTSITIFIEWDNTTNITALETIIVTTKLVITNTSFDNGSKEFTCLINPDPNDNALQYNIVKEEDTSTKNIAINTVAITRIDATTVALQYSWGFLTDGTVESQAILEMDISTRINLGIINVYTENITPPPNQQYNIPNDPDVLTLGTENTKLYIEGVNTSMIMNSIQRNISFLNSVNYTYQKDMQLGIYLEWDYYLVNQPLYSFNVEIKLYVVDTAFNTMYKENSFIINPDLTTDIQYVIIKDNSIDNKLFKQLDFFVEKINYRKILIYYNWQMASNETECQSMIDVNVISKVGLGNMVIQKFTNA